ncbi:hypothetical protein RIF29_12769 [Crotalaria pallida]|uniref:Cytochrome P450 n=1 Tax=Crotalaria pallida TaxID=3830 RepID=A0AAN9INJ7_CROPI
MIFQYLDTVVAVVVGILLILSYYYYLIKRVRESDSALRKPPIAPGGWPIIGHLPLLGDSSYPPHISLGSLADKLGPIFSIKIGVHPAVVVSSWELAKECFTTLDVIVSSRPKFTAAKILGHNYANFGFSPYGDYWREMRKITASELLSTRRFELHRGIRDSEVNSSLKELYKTWVGKRDHGSRDILMEMKQWLGDLNLNVILKMIAGKRYSATSEDQQQVRHARRVLREFFRLTGVLVIGDAVPMLGWLDFLGGQVKEMKKIAKEMDNIVGEWLEEHRLNRNSGGNNITEQDFIDVLLSVVQAADHDLAGYDSDTVIKATCLTLIAGATDTTAVTMTWALSLLLNNPHALKKVQAELDERVGKERLITESDMDKLVYLQAVVKETLRLYPAGPLSGPRVFTEDCTLGGYHIKAGTRFILNLWKLHRDPRVWSDPLEFKPERFLSAAHNKGVDVKGQHFELLPFGGGRRSCPGIPFGLQMTQLALAGFLHAFEVTTPYNGKVDMGATFGLTIIKTTPLEVLAKPRLSPALYQ